MARQHRRFDRLQSAVRSPEPKRATRDVASAFGATAGSDTANKVQQPPSILDSCIQRPPPESDTRPAKSSIDVDGIRAGIALETLTREFPSNPDDIGPTRLANARRAHSARMNFGLDEEAVLPLIEALATTDQRAMLEDARTELAFLINAVLWAVVVVLVAIVRVVTGGPQQWCVRCYAWQASRRPTRSVARPARPYRHATPDPPPGVSAEVARI